MFQLIACDYDGTLVPAGKTLSAPFFTKLNRWAMSGTTFCIASGRPYNQLKKFFSPGLQNAVIIADDGALVMYRHCVLMKKPIPTSAAVKVSRLALEEGMTPLVSLREENHRVTSERLALPGFFSSDVFKLILFKNGRETKTVKEQAMAEGLRQCYEDDTFLEFCRADADKGDALCAVMRKFSVSAERLLVLGDGENDLPMLRLTDHRVRPEKCRNPYVSALVEEAVPDVEEYLIKL